MKVGCTSPHITGASSGADDTTVPRSLGNCCRVADGLEPEGGVC